MKKALWLALLIAQPAGAAVQPASTPAAESKQPHSSVSVLVEPKLSDGRLVVRIAAKNLNATPAPFGPSSISIAKPSGEAIALYPLGVLVDDVRAAAGMAPETPPTAPTQGAYASPQMNVRDGRPDVSNYTGGAAVAGDEYIRRNRNRARRGKPTISEAEAQSQIAALRQAILQDGSVAPGQVTAGQIVTERLRFKKGADRTLHLRVRLAGDEHGFTIEAPES